MKKFIICIISGIILVVSAHTCCQKAKTNMIKMSFELHEHGITGNPSASCSIDKSIMTIKWLRRILILSGILITLFGFITSTKYIHDHYSDNYYLENLNESSIINLYLKILKISFNGALFLSLLMVSIIVGSIFGPITLWIDGLDIAIGDKNKGIIRTGKIILYPLLWGIGGLIRGPIYTMNSFRAYLR